MRRARAVIAAPAFTLEGMLMKIHVAGFAFDDIKSFSAPYHGMQCETGIQQWEADKGTVKDELALIVSIRNDLHRLMGRRV